MIQNVVELRVFAVNTAKEYAKDVQALIKDAGKIEEYVRGNATIPEVVEDPNNYLVKAFEQMRKSTFAPTPPLPEFPELKEKKTRKKKSKTE